MNRRVLSWQDVEALLEHLWPQFYGSFDALLMINRGGLIPGGLIAERLNPTHLWTAVIEFPAEPPHELTTSLGDRLLHARPLSQARPSLGLPRFVQFPPDSLLEGQRTIIVHHVWNHGRAVNAAAGRVATAGGVPAICVLHYKPASSIFPHLKPDFYAAVTSDYIVYPWEISHRLEPYRPMTEPT